MKKLLILMLVLAMVSPVFAASLRLMQLEIVDEFWEPMTDITQISVFDAGTGSASTIFMDRAGNISVTNPITTSSTNSTFLQDRGLVQWFQTAASYKVTITNGTKVLTIDNMNSSLTRFPWYENYIGTAASLSVNDNQEIVVGTDSDMVLSWNNGSGFMSWVPAADGSAFNLGTSGTGANVDFNWFVGTALGIKGDEGAATLVIDGLTTSINASSNFATNINTGTSTGAVTIGSSTSGTLALDTTAGMTINADDSIDMTTSGAAADIDVDAAAGSVIIDGGEAIADAVTITAPSGGVDISAAATFDIDINSTGGRVNITASENVQNTVHLEANGGTLESVNIYSNQGTGASASTEHDASVQLQSDDGGISLYTTGNIANAIRIEANAGSSETITVQSVQGTSVTEGAASVNLFSTVGGIGIRSTANLANAVNITVDGGSTSTIELFNDQGTSATEGAASIQLISDVGGIAVQSGLNGVAIVLLADGGTSETILIHADQGTGVDSVTITSDDGGITLNTGTGTGDAITYNGRTDSLIIIEGTADAFETSITFTDPTADGTINFPDTGDEGAAGGDIVWIANAGSTTKDTTNAALPLTDAIVLGTSGGASAWSLANGEDGQILTVIIVVDGGEAIITPATSSGWATAVLTDDIDGITMMYIDDSVGWIVLGTSSDGSGIVAITQ